MSLLRICPPGLASCFALLVAVAAPAIAQAQAPKGWLLAGNRPQDYRTGVDRAVAHDGKPSAFLRSQEKQIDGFGTLMQSIAADEYRGRRVRFSGFAKSEGVVGWAGLWMRVDGNKREPLGFDNMQERAIKGTTPWRRYDVVLDVPESAQAIAFGVLLSDTGTVWFSDARLDVVDRSVPTTGAAPVIPAKPRNLDFSE